MLVFHSKVTNGKLIASVSQQIRDVLAKFGDGYVKITIDTTSKRRTGKQNAYKWSVVIETVRKAMAKEGQVYSPEEVNEIIKRGILGLFKEVTLPDGAVIVITGDMKDGDTQIWEDQMTMIRAYFDEFGIYIPEPNEIINHGE